MDQSSLVLNNQGTEYSNGILNGSILSENIELKEPFIINSGDSGDSGISLDSSLINQSQNGVTEKILLELEYCDADGIDATAANKELLEYVNSLQSDGLSNNLSLLSMTEQTWSKLTDSSGVSTSCKVITSTDMKITDVNNTDVNNIDVNNTDVNETPKRVYKERFINLNDEVAEFDELARYSKIDWNNKKRKRIVKCYNCDIFFELWEFAIHVCYGGKSKDLKVSDNKTKNANTKEVDEDAEKSLRLTRENQIRIRRFLKDDLRYDVNAHITIIGETANTFNSKKYGPHECNLCERKFVHASGLLRHMEKHQMDLIPITANPTRQFNKTDYKPINNGLNAAIKCIMCGRIFFSPSAAMEHLAVHFPYSRELQHQNVNQIEKRDIDHNHYVDVCTEYLECNETEFQDSSDNEWIDESTISKYLKVVILSCILQCEFCDFFFADTALLLVHSSYHAPNRNFECLTCEIYGLSAKEITMHWQGDCIYMRNHFKKYSKNLSRYFVCNVCEHKFPTLEYLFDHRQTSFHFFPRLNNDTEGTLYVSCEQCCLIVNNVYEMVEHYEEKHCKRNRRGDKKDQIGTNKARQFLCEVCGKSYTQSSHLWQHLRFHQGIKPFACEEAGCTRKFTIRPDLNDHIRKCHTGERPYHCVDCGKRFLTGSVFYQHRLIHRGERRYKCDQCHKRFYRADALKNHQRIHTGEKPFSCIYCTKSFRQRGDRDKHIRARHAHLDNKSKLLLQMHKYHLEQKALKKKENGGNENDTVSNDMPMELDMTSETMTKLAAKWAAATP